MLRQKVWHLLDLPDYCEELIVLKSPSDVEIALTELRKGNDPQRPYILEVWLPGMQSACKKLFSSVLIFSVQTRIWPKIAIATDWYGRYFNDGCNQAK